MQRAKRQLALHHPHLGGQTGGAPLGPAKPARVRHRASRRPQRLPGGAAQRARKPLASRDPRRQTPPSRAFIWSVETPEGEFRSPWRPV